MVINRSVLRSETRVFNAIFAGNIRLYKMTNLLAYIANEANAENKRKKYTKEIVKECVDKIEND